jgi:hypothetical protein
MTSMLSVPMNLDKIAIPNISTASFTIPNAAVSAGATNGIIGNVTNNYNNNNVNVNAASANAHEVADIVIRHFNTIESQKVGGM